MIKFKLFAMEKGHSSESMIPCGLKDQHLQPLLISRPVERTASFWLINNNKYCKQLRAFSWKLWRKLRIVAAHNSCSTETTRPQNQLNRFISSYYVAIYNNLLIPVAARFLRLRARIPPYSWIFFCGFYVSSVVGLTTRPYESCRVCCVWVWSGSSVTGDHRPASGWSVIGKKNKFDFHTA
jgi:hypothetical protein